MDINELFETPFFAPYKKLFRIFTQWAEIVGEEYSRRSEPLFVDNGKFLIRADDEFAMTELHFIKEEIKEKVNLLLGERFVTDVKIICRKKNPKKKFSPPVETVEIPSEVKRALEKISDPGLREKMEKFCLRIIAIRKRKDVE